MDDQCKKNMKDINERLVEIFNNLFKISMIHIFCLDSNKIAECLLWHFFIGGSMDFSS